MLGNIDPATMQNFWNALITLMIAISAYLQRRNAQEGKKRGEETKQAAMETRQAAEDTKNAAVAAKQVSQNAADDAKAAAILAASAAKGVAAHNTQAMEKLDTIERQTNGVNEALAQKVAQQTAAILSKDKQISDLQGGGGHDAST